LYFSSKLIDELALKMKVSSSNSKAERQKSQNSLTVWYGINWSLMQWSGGEGDREESTGQNADSSLR